MTDYPHDRLSISKKAADMTMRESIASELMAAAIASCDDEDFPDEHNVAAYAVSAADALIAQLAAPVEPAE